MSDRNGHAKRRWWTNIVVIGASAYCIAAATHMPLELATGDVGEAVRFELWLSAVYVLAGVLGMAAVFTSTRWPRFGRVPLILAVALLVSGFFALHGVALLPVLSLGIPALAMLGALPFMGPMPGPGEEAAEDAERVAAARRQGPTR
jgi:hypothetical protein